MAAAEAWKTRFRERVLEAHGRLSMVVWRIGNARGSLAAPLRAPATEAARARIRCAERALEDASSDLAAAASLLGSAEQLALRGGAIAPWDPLPSASRLPDAAAAQREASRKLGDAMLLANKACHGVDVCFFYLPSLRLLLDHPLLPGVDKLLEADRVSAFDFLKEPMEAADGCVSLVVSAREDVSGPGGAN
jgi:hypothetical protein